ncbi:hypothetical protein PUV54_08565 [Hyphococcus flavus]|uniref:Right handed beta helix domain-containing protein n=1 Tax=Hyphococcus flavus TaxID=1866326 RepID=A0AAF0CB56_9PROT|nr:hypothetical protein [Hyphococcus flavus]WDI30010.1 hypothetical protein PUV54_08565 [Hyphococcus flavus]
MRCARRRPPPRKIFTQWSEYCAMLQMMKLALTLFAALLLISQPSWADVRVDNANALERAVRNGESGEVIYVVAGRYDLSDLKIPRDLSLIGEEGVTFFSSQPVAKGILNPLWDASLHVENIRFEGATSPDLNGAGIRHDGVNLTAINCTFENNENGILATGQEHGKVVIQSSQFIGNGYGDGYSHGIYLSSGAVLEITSSSFVGTKIGHHVKSLAATTTIHGSSFDDANGKTSYAVDASRGGAVSITGSSFTQAADADNSTLFNYDLSRGGDAISLEISGNRIINRKRNGRILRNDTALAPTIENNDIINERGGTLQPQ